MKGRLVFFAAAAMLAACNSAPGPKAAGAPAAPPQFNTMEQLLAPIALYPDPLLAQILMCAAEPAKVAQLDTWLHANQSLKATALQDAAVKAGFDPSFVALALFPTVVANMAAQIGWTAQLGQAFAADRSAVFATIQKLRHQAESVGTLKDTPQQDVSTRTTSGGEQVIVIEPANPQVVYVPQYNTQTVYTTAPPPAPVVTNTTVVVHEDNSAEQAMAAGLIGFTAGIVIGASMNNSYYYGPYGWHGGAYMYNDAWNDYYDAREDAREDWMDHREDMIDERGDRAENARDQRTDRAENRQDTRGTTQQQRTERSQNRQEARPSSSAQRSTAASAQRSAPSTASPASASTQSAAQRSSARTGSTEARGYGDGSRTASTTPRTTTSRSGSTDAFSGYSSGASQRASSQRGNRSRSSSGGGGGRRR